MPYEHKRVKIDQKFWMYVGKYNAALTMEFIKKNDRLYIVIAEGTPDIELIPKKIRLKFFYGDSGDRQILFQKIIQRQNYLKVWFYQYGSEGEMKKWIEVGMRNEEWELISIFIASNYII